MILQSVVFVVACFCVVSLPNEECLAQKVEMPKKINEKAAQQLTAEAYGGRVPLGYFDYNERLDDLFYTFQGIGPQSTFGFFSVNPWTGDVWALWGCHRMNTPALRKSQAEIRKRFTSTEMKQYARLSRLKPDCIVEN